MALSLTPVQLSVRTEPIIAVTSSTDRTSGRWRPSLGASMPSQGLSFLSRAQGPRLRAAGEFPGGTAEIGCDVGGRDFARSSVAGFEEFADVGAV